MDRFCWFLSYSLKKRFGYLVMGFFLLPYPKGSNLLGFFLLLRVWAVTALSERIGFAGFFPICTARARFFGPDFLGQIF